MKKYLVIIPIIILSIYMLGCGKKQAVMEEPVGSVKMEELTVVTPDVQTVPEAKTTAAGDTLPAPKLEPLPPQGPYKPTAVEIQTALKNANFYTGAIDGKIGPQTKKAIEEFQNANGLEVDGKVGPKTWAVLSKYLNPQPAISTATPVKKKR